VAEYRGPAELAIDGEVLRVDVALAGRVEPVDGAYHWGGRIAPHPRVAELVRSGRRAGTLAIGGDGVGVQLKDLDPWGGVVVRSVGAAPRTLIEEGTDVS
jgi:hypothetical protein